MNSETKKRLFLENEENTVLKIKELTSNYDIEADEVEDFLKRIFEIILSNENIFVQDDMTDVYTILEYVTADQSSAKTAHVNQYERPRTIDESVIYYVKDIYDYAFEMDEMDEDYLTIKYEDQSLVRTNN